MPDIAFWKELARELRPYVELCDRFPFREQYLPSSVEWYAERCTIHSRDSALDEPATPENFARYNDRQTYLLPDNEDVYNGEGTSAPYYTHLAEARSGVVQIQYHFFYPFNGPVALNCLPIPTAGFHQGDWEKITMEVDVERRRILSVFFSAHGDVGQSLTKSTEGDPDQTHYQVRNGRPVVYAAWHSHASYSDRGKHIRLGALCDPTAGGLTWDGDVAVVSIDPNLLPSGVSLPEPSWLNWLGRWGSTQQSFDDSWFSNSPDGPKINDSWMPHGRRGTWGDWKQISFDNNGDKDARPSLIVVGNDLVLAFTEEFTETVMVAARPSNAGWSQPQPVGNLPVKSPPRSLELVVAGDGNVILFARADNGLLFWTATKRRGDVKAWNVWAPFNPVPDLATAFAVASGGDALIHLLIASNKGLVDVAQTEPNASSGWGEPQPLAFGAAQQWQNILTTHQEDGTLMALYGIDGFFSLLAFRDQQWIAEETPRSGAHCFPWSFTRNADGRLEVFGVDYEGGKGVAQHAYAESATRPYRWSTWIDLSPPNVDVKMVVAAPEANGVLALMATDVLDNRVWFNRQAEKDWHSWSPLGNTYAAQLALALNSRGRLWAVGVRPNLPLAENFETSSLG